jgi:hypothetical protein
MSPRAAAELGLSVLSASEAAEYRNGESAAQAPPHVGESGPELVELPAGWSPSVTDHDYGTHDDPASSPGEQDPDATAEGTTDQEG